MTYAQSPAARRADAPNVRWALALFALAGLALRVWYAHWPLWVDEIWSLKDLAPLRGASDVLWKISQDNNHYLYSIYLYFAFPLSHEGVWLRAPSILAGVASVWLAARLSRRDEVAATFAAGLMAVSLFFVTYGAQARGYATAAALWLAAYAFLERAIEQPTARARWGFALAMGTAAFFHLITFAVGFLFGLAAFFELWRRQRNFLAAVGDSWRIFWPSLVGLAPIALCLAAGYVEVGGFIINFVRPFAPSLAFMGYSQMAAATLAGTTHPLVVLAVVPLVLLGLAALSRAREIPPFRRIVYGVTILGLPLFVFLTRTPNSHIPRYYLVSAAFLVLAAADLFALVWRKGGAWRVGAGVLAAALAFGHLSSLAASKAANVAAWPEALATVAASPSPTLGDNFDFNVREFVGYYNRFADKPLRSAGQTLACEAPPEWYIVETEAANQPQTISVSARAAGGTACEFAYALAGRYGDSTFFESRWFLYRRATPN